jgi:DNA repair photolyase
MADTLAIAILMNRYLAFRPDTKSVYPLSIMSHESEPPRNIPAGRAGIAMTPNRFERIHVEADLSQLAADDELLAGPTKVATEFLDDTSQSILSENSSPDIPFSHSINPYRGCEHGCAYCYARPYHEFLGFNAGLDFETKILVKRDAAKLLREALNHPRWKGEHIAFSGVTDCYQPAERHFEITRACLAVMLEAQQCCSIITKNGLVTRDLDILAPLANEHLTKVLISITTLDAELARVLEPRTSTPAARLCAIAALRAAGVPVGVMVAPILPGLTDHQVPAILKAASEAGAQWAGFTLLRLPMAVGPIFTDWLQRTMPDAAEKILARVRDVHAGEVDDREFGRRMRGAGEYAAQVRRTFEIFATKYSLKTPLPQLNTTKFRSPRSAAGQMRLF